MIRVKSKRHLSQSEIELLMNHLDSDIMSFLQFFMILRISEIWNNNVFDIKDTGNDRKILMVEGWRFCLWMYFFNNIFFYNRIITISGLFIIFYVCYNYLNRYSLVFKYVFLSKNLRIFENLRKVNYFACFMLNYI